LSLDSGPWNLQDEAWRNNHYRYIVCMDELTKVGWSPCHHCLDYTILKHITTA